MSKPTTTKRTRARTPNNRTTTGFRISDPLWALLESWQLGVEQFDELQGIDWNWLSMDGAMTKAPLGGGEKRPQSDRPGQTGGQTQSVMLPSPPPAGDETQRATEGPPPPDAPPAEATPAAPPQ